MAATPALPRCCAARSPQFRQSHAASNVEEDDEASAAVSVGHDSASVRPSSSTATRSGAMPCVMCRSSTVRWPESGWIVLGQWSRSQVTWKRPALPSDQVQCTASAARVACTRVEHARRKGTRSISPRCCNECRPHVATRKSVLTRGSRTARFVRYEAPLRTRHVDSAQAQFDGCSTHMALHNPL